MTETAVEKKNGKSVAFFVLHAQQMLVQCEIKRKVGKEIPYKIKKIKKTFLSPTMGKLQHIQHIYE